MCKKLTLTKVYTHVRNLRARKRARKSVYARVKRPFTRTLADLHTRKFFPDFERAVTQPILGVTAYNDTFSAFQTEHYN